MQKYSACSTGSISGKYIYIFYKRKFINKQELACSNNILATGLLFFRQTGKNGLNETVRTENTAKACYHKSLSVPLFRKTVKNQTAAKLSTHHIHII